LDLDAVERQDLVACMSGSAIGLGEVGVALKRTSVSLVLPAYSLEGRLSGLWRVEPSGGGDFIVRAASTLLGPLGGGGGLLLANASARRLLERGRLRSDPRGWIVDGVSEFLLAASSEDSRQVPILGIPDGCAGSWVREAARRIDAERIVLHDDIEGWRLWAHLGLGKFETGSWECISVGPRIPLLGGPSAGAGGSGETALGETA
jgi:hypothetical protein